MRPKPLLWSSKLVEYNKWNKPRSNKKFLKSQFINKSQ